MQNQLSPQCVLIRNSSIFSAKVDDEIVMMDEKQCSYFGLNPVAGSIWEILSSPLSLDGLVDKLTERYKVDREKCLTDIQPFILKMMDHKLIREQ